MSNKKDFMLSTIDNPYNPFTQFDEWNSYDIEKGYNTCAYLARITKSSEELSDVEEELAIDDAINQIVSMDILGIYIKVFN